MKKVWMTGKQWLNIGSFINDFPFVKLPLVMLWLDSIAPNGSKLMPKYTKGGGSTSIETGLSAFNYNKIINTYRDTIRFAISPEYPLIIQFAPKDLKSVSEQAARVLFDPKDFDGTSAEIGRILTREYLATDKTKKDWYAANRKDRYYFTVLTKKDRIIEFILKHAFKNFEVFIQPSWQDFDEVYGNFSSVDQVPKNTIGYVVTKLGPPKIPESMYKTADFWHKMFGNEIGSAVLNAAAANMPVKIKTRVEDWKNPQHPYMSVVRKNDYNAYFFKWVFQDFDIEIGRNNNILVKYMRGYKTLTIVQQKTQDTWFDRWFPLIGILTIVTLGTVGVIAAGGAAGTSATVAGGAATGAELASTAVVSTTTVATAAPVVTAVTVPTGTGLSIGGVSLATAAKVVTVGSSLIGAGTSLTSGSGGGRGGGSSEVSSGDPSLLDNIISIAKPLINTGVQVYSAKQAREMQEGQSYDIYADGVLPTVQGVNQYQPITGTVPEQISEAGMFGGIPIQWVLISGGVLSLIYLMTQKQSGKRR